MYMCKLGLYNKEGKVWALKISEGYFFEKINDIKRKYESDENDINEDINDFVTKLVSYIFDTEDEEILDELKDKCENYNLWESVEHLLYPQIIPFLRIKTLKHVDAGLIKKYIEMAFGNKYFDYETEEYFLSEYKIQKEVTESLFNLLIICENSIIMRMSSKRRFAIMVSERLKLDSEIIDFLWQEYDDNRDKIEKQVYYNRIMTLDMKINDILENQHDIIEELQFIEYLTMEGIDEEE